MFGSNKTVNVILFQFRVKLIRLKCCSGECFDLLGKYQLSKIYESCGYCPQFDALLPEMTCRETMTLFATLRGIPLKNVHDYVVRWSQRLGFIQHIDKQVGQLR